MQSSIHIITTNKPTSSLFFCRNKISYSKQIARQLSCPKKIWPRHGHGRSCKQYFLASSLISVQILVAVSHTLCAHVGRPKFRRRWGPALLGSGVTDLLERHPPTCVNLSNFIVLGQTVQACVWRSDEKMGTSRHAFRGHSR